MIGSLKGQLIWVEPPTVIVDIHGIGYEVEISQAALSQLPPLQSTVSLFTHLIVREDAHLLYGFADRQELRLFRTLLKVSGVGPKVALAILGGISADHFVQAVMEQQATRLTKIPGVGKKMAERLIIEMRDRLKDWLSESVGAMSVQSQAAASSSANLSPTHEAVSALIALGYKPYEASQVIAELAHEYAGSETLIREALKRFAKVTS